MIIAEEKMKWENIIIALQIVSWLDKNELTELKADENLKEWNYLLFKEMLYPTQL